MCDGCIRISHELDNWKVESDCGPALCFEDHSSLMSRFSPALTGSIEMPRSLHLEVCVQTDIAHVEEEVLSSRAHGSDHFAGQIDCGVSRYPKI